MSSRRISRRRAIALGLRAGLGACSLPSLLRHGNAAQESGPESELDLRIGPGLDPGLGSQRKLLVLQLSGGNDGLDTVIPFDDDAYHAARPTLALARSGVIPIDDALGLHPALKGLAGLYQEGHVALVQGVGYPAPNRSHFKSFEVWHTANLGGRDRVEAGWIGRMQGGVFGEEANPNRVVHLGKRTPFSLHSRAYPPTSLDTPSLYRWAGDESARGANRKGSLADKSSAGPLDDLRRIARSAQSSSEDIRRVTAAYRPRVDYSDDEFGASLRHAAALLSAELGTRVVSVELSGFDTHSDQRTRRGKLLQQLDRALTPLVRDLEGTKAGAETLILVFSEFGRRVQENASQGTDHGAAGPVLVLHPGGSAQALSAATFQPGLFGSHPALDQLDERGDLVHSVDFRALYATLIERWLGGDASAVLGEPFQPLPFLV